ncbi:hypothetical protein M378DRAFT_655864 [Amanita muscaria Koide BX008]|uniref:Uncharacterized protein n=1 Tax=Amanita muscaria (strain Koide BX008) TaxID=946122 RepID=A0A0C2WPY6_AMAMK|nr:hypothetical protein M378DRAFT_655864 [Amanita muscaria Koide BX008]
MALYHTASNQIYRSIGNIQNLLDRFGNEVTVISLDGYNAEIQGLSADQSTFVLEILRCTRVLLNFSTGKVRRLQNKNTLLQGKKNSSTPHFKSKRVPMLLLNKGSMPHLNRTKGTKSLLKKSAMMYSNCKSASLHRKINSSRL